MLYKKKIVFISIFVFNCMFSSDSNKKLFMYLKKIFYEFIAHFNYFSNSSYY